MSKERLIKNLIYDEKTLRVMGFLLKERHSFWDLIPRMDYLPEFVAIIKNLKKRKLLNIKNSELMLSDRGKKVAKKLKITALSLPESKKIREKYKKLSIRLKKIIKKEEYFVYFDQLPLSVDGIVKKLEFMEEKGDLEGRKIICIGDDDFFATSLMLTKQPDEIGVIDIDPKVLNYEKEIAKKLNIKTNFLLHNLVKPIPPEFRQKYDIFISEPPDTIKGHLLFCSRAMECLKKEGGIGYIGITKASLSLGKIKKIQENFLKMSGVITDILSKFEVYDTIGDEFEWISGLPKGIFLPKKPWFFADLMRIEFLKPKSLIKGKFKTPYIEEVLMTKFKF